MHSHMQMQRNKSTFGSISSITSQDYPSKLSPFLVTDQPRVVITDMTALPSAAPVDLVHLTVPSSSGAIPIVMNGTNIVGIQIPVRMYTHMHEHRHTRTCRHAEPTHKAYWRANRGADHANCCSRY